MPKVTSVLIHLFRGWRWGQRHQSLLTTWSSLHLIADFVEAKILPNRNLLALSSPVANLHSRLGYRLIPVWRARARYKLRLPPTNAVARLGESFYGRGGERLSILHAAAKHSWCVIGGDGFNQGDPWILGF